MSRLNYNLHLLPQHSYDVVSPSRNIYETVSSTCQPVRFNLFDYIRFFSFFIGTLNSMINKKCDIYKISKYLTSILLNMNNFHSLEVVDRVSETQLQVGENSN